MLIGCLFLIGYKQIARGTGMVSRGRLLADLDIRGRTDVLDLRLASAGVRLWLLSLFLKILPEWASWGTSLIRSCLREGGKPGPVNRA